MKTFSTLAFLAIATLPAFAQDATPSRMKNEPPAPAEQRTDATPKRQAMVARQISASKLLDESVMNEANESIGDVNDVLISSDGKIDAVIVGVGGFLGLGEKNVALSFDQLKFTRDNNNDLVVTTNATKEGLQAAPGYDSTAND